MQNQSRKQLHELFKEYNSLQVVNILNDTKSQVLFVYILEEVKNLQLGWSTDFVMKKLNFSKTESSSFRYKKRLGIVNKLAQTKVYELLRSDENAFKQIMVFYTRFYPQQKWNSTWGEVKIKYRLNNLRKLQRITQITTTNNDSDQEIQTKRCKGCIKRNKYIYLLKQRLLDNEIQISDIDF